MKWITNNIQWFVLIAIGLSIFAVVRANKLNKQINPSETDTAGSGKDKKPE